MTLTSRTSIYVYHTDFHSSSARVCHLGSLFDLQTKSCCQLSVFTSQYTVELMSVERWLQQNHLIEFKSLESSAINIRLQQLNENRKLISMQCPSYFHCSFHVSFDMISWQKKQKKTWCHYIIEMTQFFCLPFPSPHFLFSFFLLCVFVSKIRNTLHSQLMAAIRPKNAYD